MDSMKSCITRIQLKLLISTKKGFAFKSKWYSTKGTHIVKVSDFTEDSIDTSNLTCIPNRIAVDYQDWVLREDDVIIQTVGSYPRNPDSVVGKTIRVPAAADGALLNQNAVILKPDISLLKGFLFYGLKSKEFKEHVHACARGSANQASITLKDILGFSILLPTIKVQEKCVSILSTCDELLGVNNQIILALQKTKKGLMQHLLTRGIGHTEFKKTKVGEIPAEWDTVELGDSTIAKIVGGTTPSRKIPAYWGGSIPWATPSDITALSSSEIGQTKDSVTETGFRESSLSLLPPGSVLMTSRATIGYCAINAVPMTTNQGFASFICKDRICNRFLLHVLEFMKRKLEQLATGSTFKEVSKSTLRKLRVPLPPLNEQRRIAGNLDSISTEILLEKQYRQALESLKKGLMQVLLTGKVRVEV